jgi:hypothetical protein
MLLLTESPPCGNFLHPFFSASPMAPRRQPHPNVSSMCDSALAARECMHEVPKYIEKETLYLSSLRSQQLWSRQRGSGMKFHMRRDNQPESRDEFCCCTENAAPSQNLFHFARLNLYFLNFFSPDLAGALGHKTQTRTSLGAALPPGEVTPSIHLQHSCVPRGCCPYVVGRNACMSVARCIAPAFRNSLRRPARNRTSSDVFSVHVHALITHFHLDNTRPCLSASLA